MTPAAWAAVLVAGVAVAGVVVEVLRARRRGLPSRVPLAAGTLTVALFALAAAWLLGVGAHGSPGVPRRYATYEPGPVLRPEVLLIAAGAAMTLAGLLSAHRSAGSAERTGAEVARGVRTVNVVLTVAGAGLVVLALLALLP